MPLFNFFKKQKAKEDQEIKNIEIDENSSDQDDTSINMEDDAKDDISNGINAETTEQYINDLEKEELENPKDVKELENIEELEELKVADSTISEEGEENEEDKDTQNLEQDDEEKTENKTGFFKKIIEGLGKTRKSLLTGVENVLKGFTKIDEELFEELEEVLIMADIGTQTSMAIIESVKDRVKKEKVSDVEKIQGLLIEEIAKILNDNSEELVITPPTIILIIGVNGVGKTTTIGKLSNIYKRQGKKVMLAAGDTFRAAAIDQLEVWSNRSKVDLIKHQENSDPAAVVFDAVKAAKARKTDILICDTAGRLHNKRNLMEELRKIYKVIGREYPEAQLETFLVLDGTTGQNALQQAKSFKEICDITGLVLTKLDGTAKGGVVIAIKNELNIPVRFIGVGEGLDDLQEFKAVDFANALFYKDQQNDSSK